MVTSEWTQNVVLILAGIDVNPTQTWYEVRLPILPNNSTGWVPRSALGNLHTVHTHLYVHRATFTATLKRDGRTIFTTRVGVGRSSWPTPAGQFYIRDKITGFHKPFYGPIAFGTSARSAVLTDWPGGGFIGVHGTNEPADPSRSRLTRMHPHDQRRDPPARAADAGRHAAHRHLTRPCAGDGSAGFRANKKRPLVAMRAHRSV